MLALTNLVLEELPEDSPVRSDLEMVVLAAERSKNLVSQILAFSRQDELDRKPVNLGEVIREAVSLLRSSLPATIEICVDLDESMPLVTADATQMHQILMNLASNAAHAMEPGNGSLEIILEPVEFDGTEALPCRELVAGRYARLVVRDNGPGMDKETLGRIFDPFFTTKDVDKGTGLGLSIVHGIVTAHEGAITVTSEPGEGTTFEVYLPFG